MRLHALIFAAGQGIPLAGVVYDPKVSAFLRYIGQEQFVDLQDLTEESLRSMIDACAARAAHPEAQAAAVGASPGHGAEKTWRWPGGCWAAEVPRPVSDLKSRLWAPQPEVRRRFVISAAAVSPPFSVSPSAERKGSTGSPAW